MEQWPEHSVQGYLTRLPTYKLEFLLKGKGHPDPQCILLPEDYTLIESILRSRPDSDLFDDTL